ncbi:hypothetical protein V2W45_1341503 [Cenococcum geophilum]
MTSSNMHISYPFDPLTPLEIPLAARIIRDAFPKHNCIFRVITLAKPSKAQMLDFLAAEKPAKVLLIRLALLCLVGKHSYIAAVDMQGSEAACLADPRVQKEIRALHLPEEAVVCVEPWAYGTDGMHDMTKRIVMPPLASSHPTTNTSSVYASTPCSTAPPTPSESHPLPLSSPTIHNPLGVGYTTTSQIIAHETRLDTSAATARTFKLINGAGRGYRGVVRAWHNA